MCFGGPGKIIEVTAGPLPTGRVQYNAIASEPVKEYSLMYLPEAEVGDYVLVQNKIAMTLMNEDEATECIEELRKNNLLDELPN